MPKYCKKCRQRTYHTNGTTCAQCGTENLYDSPPYKTAFAALLLELTRKGRHRPGSEDDIINE